MENDIQQLLSKQPILLFDGECGLCNRAILFYLKHERPAVTRRSNHMHFAPLQSEIGKQLRTYFEIDTNIDSIILIRDHSAYIKSCAALRITAYMRGLWPVMVLFVIIPPFLRNHVYDFIARRRKKVVGRLESCALLKKEEAERFLAY